MHRLRIGGCVLLGMILAGCSVESPRGNQDSGSGLRAGVTPVSQAMPARPAGSAPAVVRIPLDRPTIPQERPEDWLIQMTSFAP